MKIHFNFDTSTRSIHFEPEGGLEQLALNEIAAESEKGNLPKMIQKGEEYFLELRLNGHHKEQLKETPR